MVILTERHARSPSAAGLTQLGIKVIINDVLLGNISMVYSRLQIFPTCKDKILRIEINGVHISLGFSACVDALPSKIARRYVKSGRVQRGWQPTRLAEENTYERIFLFTIAG
jgi:hypothetical protein